MKKIIYFIGLALSIILFVVCNNKKEKEKDIQENKIQKLTPDNLRINPKIFVQVNKHIDSKGNLISFDSIYSSYFSNRVNDIYFMDSLFKIFKSPFAEKFPLVNDEYFNKLFFTDSLISSDFFHEDFFRKRFLLNEQYMRYMMRQMDSVKNDFFKRRKIPNKKN